MAAINKVAIQEFSTGDVSGSRGILFYNNQSVSTQWAVGAIADANSNFYITNGSGNLRLGIDGEGKVLIPGDMQINSNLTVNGTTTFVNTCVMTIEDPQLQLGLLDPVAITQVSRYLNLFDASPGSGYFSTPSSGAVYDAAKFPYYVFTVGSDLPATYSIGSNVFVTGTGITGLDDSVVTLASDYVSTDAATFTASIVSPTVRQFVVKGSNAEIDSSNSTWSLTSTYTYSGVDGTTMDNDAATIGGAGTLVSPLDYTTPTVAYAGKTQDLTGLYPGVAVVGTNNNGDLISENISYIENQDYWTFSSNQYVAQTNSIWFGQNSGESRIGGYNDVEVYAANNVNLIAQGVPGSINLDTGAGGAVVIDNGENQASLYLTHAEDRLAYTAGNVNLITSGNFNTTASKNIQLNTGASSTVLVKASSGDSTLEIGSSTTKLTSTGTTLTMSGTNFVFSGTNETHTLSGEEIHNVSGNITLTSGAGKNVVIAADSGDASLQIHGSGTTITSDGSRMTLDATNYTVQHGSAGAVTVQDDSGQIAYGKVFLYNSNTYVRGNGSVLEIASANGNVNVDSASTVNLVHGDSAEVLIASQTGTTATLQLVDGNRYVSAADANISVAATGGNVNVTAGDDVALTHGSGDAVAIYGASGSTAKVELFNTSTYIQSDGSQLRLVANDIALDSASLTFAAANVNFTADDNIGMFHGNQSGDHITLGTDGTITTNVYVYNSSTYFTSNGQDFVINSDNGDVKLDASSDVDLAAGSGLFHLTSSTSTTNVSLFGANTYVSSNGVDVTLAATQGNVLLTHKSTEAVVVSGGSTGTIELVNANHVIASNGTNLSLSESIGNVNVTSATNTKIVTGNSSSVILSNGSGASVLLGTGVNKITTNNTDLSLTSTSGDIALTANTDVDLAAGSGLFHLTTSAAVANVSLFGANTYVSSNGVDVTLAATQGDVLVRHKAGEAVNVSDGASAGTIELFNNSTTISANGEDVTVASTNGDVKLNASADVDFAAGSGLFHLTSSTSTANVSLFGANTYVSSNGVDVTLAATQGDVLVRHKTGEAVNVSDGSSAGTIELFNNSTTISANGADVTVASTNGDVKLNASADVDLAAGSGLFHLTSSTTTANVSLFGANTYVSSNGVDVTLAATQGNVLLTHKSAEAVVVSGGSTGTIELVNGSHVIASNGTNLSLSESIGNVNVTSATNTQIVTGTSGSVILSNGSGASILLGTGVNKITTNNTDLSLTSTSGDIKLNANTDMDITANSGIVHINSDGSNLTNVNLFNNSTYITSNGNTINIVGVELTSNTTTYTATTTGEAAITSGDYVSLTHGSTESVRVLGDSGSDAKVELFNSNTYIKSNGNELRLVADDIVLDSTNLNFAATNLSFIANDNVSLLHGNQSGDHLLLGTNGTMKTNVYLHNVSTYITSDGADVTIASTYGDVKLNAITDVDLAAGSGNFHLTSSASTANVSLFGANTYVSSNGVDVTLAATQGDVLVRHKAGEAVNVSDGSSAGTIELFNNSTTISADGADVTVASTNGDVKLNASADVDFAAGSGLFHLTSSASTANVSLFGANTYLSSNGVDVTLAATQGDVLVRHKAGEAVNVSDSSSTGTIELYNSSTTISGNGADVSVASTNGDVKLNASADVDLAAGSGLFHITSSTSTANISLFGANTYVSSNGVDVTLGASQGDVLLRHKVAEAVNVSDGASVGTVELFNGSTTVSGDGSVLTLAGASGLNLSVSGPGDLELSLQDGYNVNITGNSALTFDGGDDQFFIKYNNNNYLIIHGNNIESQGNFVSTAIGGSSDRRLKENIRPLENSLDTIQKMRGVNFTWIKNPEAGNQIGFIAQEVEAIAPELTLRDSRNFLAVQYGNITALLVEAVKEQNRMIAEMREDYNAKISIILDAFQAQSQHIAELNARMQQ